MAGFFDELATNPMFQIGLGLMGSTSPGGSFGQTLSSGFQQGMSNVTLFRNQKLVQQLQRAKLKQIEDEKRERDLKAQQMQQYLQTAPAAEQQLAMLDPKGFVDMLQEKKKAEFRHGLDMALAETSAGHSMELARFKAAQAQARAAQERNAPVRYGVDPSYEIDEEGTVYEVAHGTDGSRIVRELTNVPYDITRRSAEYRSDVASAIKKAEIAAEAEQTAKIEYPGLKAKADIALRAIRGAMEDAEGMERAVGIMSMLPTISGGKAADYERRMAQIEGSVAMEAYDDLRGAGHITVQETSWGTAAKTDIALSQSIERHRESMALLEKIIENGDIRAARKAGIKTGPLHVIRPPKRYETQKAPGDEDPRLKDLGDDPFGIR